MTAICDGCMMDGTVDAASAVVVTWRGTGFCESHAWGMLERFQVLVEKQRAQIAAQGELMKEMENLLERKMVLGPTATERPEAIRPDKLIGLDEILRPLGGVAWSGPSRAYFDNSEAINAELASEIVDWAKNISDRPDRPVNAPFAPELDRGDDAES